MTYFQQGDVILTKTTLPVGNLQETKDPILQHGEATGHMHRLTNDGFTVYQNEKDLKRYLRLVKPNLLKHEEHSEIPLPIGDYELRIVREYDHFSEEARQVRD